MRQPQYLTLRRLGAVAAAAVTVALTFTASAHAWEKGALQNLATGQCLRDYPDKLMNVGPCDGSKSTLWTKSNYSTHLTQFRNDASNWCLDNSINGLQTWPCHPDSDVKNRVFQSWRPSGMVAGVPYIQRWQSAYGSWQCLEDSTAHGLRVGTCLQHDYAGWKTQGWRFSYRDSG